MTTVQDKKAAEAQQTKLFKEVEQLGFVVDVVPVTKYNRYVWILGERFDAEDLYETMSEVKSNGSSVHMTDYRMVKAMKAIGVISGTSGTWGTDVPEKGGEERLASLLTMLKAALQESKSDIV